MILREQKRNQDNDLITARLRAGELELQNKTCKQEKAELEFKTQSLNAKISRLEKRLQESSIQMEYLCLHCQQHSGISSMDMKSYVDHLNEKNIQVEKLTKSLVEKENVILLQSHEASYVSKLDSLNKLVEYGAPSIDVLRSRP